MLYIRQQAAIDEIEKQGAQYKKFKNQWNVMQQLIDIIAVSSPDTADIVLADLKVKEMNLDAIVAKVTGARMSDPEKVMQTICDFYKIPCPSELPPEHWRIQGAAQSAAHSTAPINLMDLV